MEFYDVVAQVLNLLQRQGRVSYRALKRQFSIDDDYIEDLKEELLYAHPVIDDEGRGLIWTGATEATPITSSQSDQPEPQPVVEQAQPVQETSSPVEPHTPEAERRQLTVMFVDIVESTALAGKLDPEDYREVVRQYQQVCSEVVSRYDGYIAQYLGDGLLVYFGFPQAHEDDAQRAVRVGLGIIDVIGTLNTSLEQDKGVELAIRLGVHTGLVVVGEMGGDGRQEQLALGEVPNVAARIEGIARPNTVVISDATYRLIQGYFDCETLGEHDLRGVVQPIVVYRVLRESGVQSRLDIASTRGLTPLVGREQDSGLLLERWEQVKDGQGQVVLLSGEAGIGKSRLVQVLKDHLVDEPHTRLECRSSPYFTNSALYPIIDMMQTTLRFQSDDTPEQKLEKLEQNLGQYRLPLEESVPLFSALLSLPVPEDQYPPLNFTPQRQRQKTLETILAIILELSERQPLLFILEDLHWTDPTTLEFLGLLVDQSPTDSLCLLATCRPEFQPPWSHRSYLTGMTINRLSRDQIERMAQQVAGGKNLPDAIVQQLVDRTDGVPLYVEEMTKSVLESGVLKDVDGHYELTGSIASLSVPATLQDSLMARLDRLVTAKAVAQYAAVIGRQFSYELLHAVSQLDEATLQRELGRLVEAELVFQRGTIPQATYMFKHALIQDTAYESLLRSTRQGYHRRIADFLAERFPETGEIHPELLAYHYTEAGLNDEAIGYWQQAGEQAVQRSAHVEAISHIQNGLTLLQNIPISEKRAQQELDLQIVLGPALMATTGHHTEEVGRVYTRARELCQQVGETPQLFSALSGLHRFYFVRGLMPMARELGEQFLHLAQGRDDPALSLTGHWLLGSPLLMLGEVVSAHEHIERSLSLYDPIQHHSLAFRYGLDPGSASSAYTAMTLWVLGFPDQALRRSLEALTLAQERTHPFSLGYVLHIVACLACLRRDWSSASEYVDTGLTLAHEHGFPAWLLFGSLLQGWTRVGQGQLDVGITQQQENLATFQATGTELLMPWLLIELADAHKKAGRPDEGRLLLGEALDNMSRTEQRFWESEVYRLQGECLFALPVPDTSKAESCFQRAISIAQNQSAKSWELRAATSLAKLWQGQGKRQEAYDLLDPVYSWFTEGFDTADLIDAKALLDELS